MSEQDEQWFDALAGHSSPANAQDQRLQHALRQAAAIDAAVKRDELAERRLLERLEREGLLASARESRQPRRMVRPRLAQVAVIVLCLGLLLDLSLMPSLERAEEHIPRSLDQLPDGAMPALEAAPEMKAASESASPSRAPQLPLQAEDSIVKPAVLESSSAELADRAASSAFSPQSNTALRSVKSPLAKREPEQAAELWVEDTTQARKQLQAWLKKAPVGAAQESDVSDDSLMRLTCNKAEACKELADVLQTLSLRPLSNKPRPGQALLLRLREKP